MVNFYNNEPEQRDGRVVVIGGGAAGVLAALHLIGSPGTREVVLVEPSFELGFGTAYRSRHPSHLLNVPAGRMSAFADRPGDFVSWLGTAGGGRAEVFAPRRLFGEYLRDHLATACSEPAAARFEHVRGDATRIDYHAGGVSIVLADGRAIESQLALLAIGQPQDRLSGVVDASLYAGPRFVADPWAAAAFDQIRRGDSTLLIGTGLTMVDVALELAERGVMLEAVSRRGLLPQVHAIGRPAPPPAELPPGVGLRDLLRLVRERAATAEHWTATVDALRPRTQEVWRGLSASEQNRFLRHLAAHWNVHRHRMPPQTATALTRLRESGQLTIRSGTVKSIRAADDKLVVEVQPRGSAKSALVHTDHVINCAGPRPQLGDDPPRLVRALVESGIARLDTHGIGLETNDEGALIDQQGVASQHLFAIGALRRGTLLESTAVPELRTQAKRFALLASAQLPVPEPSRDVVCGRSAVD